MLLSTERPLWRPYTQEQAAPPPIELERAQGAYLYDRAGRRYFDGISSWWLITHGHCHPEIVAAVQKQAARLDQVTFANFTHAPAEELAELLREVLPPELTRIFLTDNGSTAVEAALKMAIQACAQRGQPARRKFLAFAGAYHGDTVGAMSVSGASVFNRPYRPVLFEVIRAAHPTLSTAPVEEFTADFRRLLEEHGDTLAGVILEPLVQGAGGMIIWPDEAVREIARLCRARGIYLIFDEVMTGFGRTGPLFAMDRLGITPDLVCLSKGLTGGTLPLAVTAVREEIYASFLSPDRNQMFFHGHSFTGNPIACAAAVASLRIFRTPEARAQRLALESAQREALTRVRAQLPLLDARACGTIAAIEIDADEPDYGNAQTARLMERALAEGIFIRPLGNVIYLMPPYCTPPETIHWAWDALVRLAGDSDITSKRQS